MKADILIGTSAVFSARNPILADGEFGYETDTGALKVGDGATAWNNLGNFIRTDTDQIITGFWRYETQFAVNTQGSSWWWWNGFYVEAYDPTYTLVWSMAEDIPGGGTGDPTAGFATALFSNTGSVAPYLEFDRARGTSGNPDFVDVGDELGTIRWLTYTSDSGAPPFNAIERNTQATISVVVDEDRTTTGTDYEIVSLYFRLADGTALRPYLRFQGGGGIATYDATGTVAVGGAKEAGTLNTKGYYNDGVPIALQPQTVAQLPAASTAGAGARGFVTDATATTFHSVVAGSGANFVPVFSDGTNWRIG